jgi:hypothetical protein
MMPTCLALGVQRVPAYVLLQSQNGSFPCSSRTWGYLLSHILAASSSRSVARSKKKLAPNPVIQDHLTDCLSIGLASLQKLSRLPRRRNLHARAYLAPEDLNRDGDAKGSHTPVRGKRVERDLAEQACIRRYRKILEAHHPLENRISLKVMCEGPHDAWQWTRYIPRTHYHT